MKRKSRWRKRLVTKMPSRCTVCVRYTVYKAGAFLRMGTVL
jgi:hypothetical protein